MRLRPDEKPGSAGRRLLERCVGASRQGIRGGDWSMCYLEQALLLLDACNPAATSGVEPRVAAAMDLMARRLSEPVTLATVADAAGVSVPQLLRLFHKHVGSTPIAFLERRRMERACQLLALTPSSIGDVAREVGYFDAGYFSTRFRRYAGVSPRLYRREAFTQPRRTSAAI